MSNANRVVDIGLGPLIELYCNHSTLADLVPTVCHPLQNQVRVRACELEVPS